MVLGRAGKYDGIVPEYLMPQRAKYYKFSAPFPGGPVGFFKKKTFRLEYKNFDDLAQQFIKANWKIGVVREYVNTMAFDMNPNIAKIKDLATSDTLNMKKLIAGRIPLIVIDKNTGHFIINKLPNATEILNEFEFVEPPLEQKDFFICFSRKSPFYEEKMTDFNKGYKILEEKGIVNTIMNNHNLQYYTTEYEKDVNTLFQE